MTAATFRALHVPGTPIILYNAWDAGSAQAIAKAGAKAIATGSWSVAAAHGEGDGESLPLELAIANLRRIVAAVALPVTIDLERGYDDVAGTVAAAAEAGAVGCNLEDSLGDKTLRSVEAQVERLRAARQAAGTDFFINARTDVFFGDAPHNAALVETALDRAQAYAAAGANGLFVPGLADPALIADLTARSPLPVNLMMTPASPAPADLAKLGVARLSHGPFPYLKAMQQLEADARAAFA
ncbi:isocitrate lyase/phosphoenolpyruvate mutase family protein [Sphingoaurantiacus capsulatus]|uniref:Isocitrate lyase/phosphoenolpyruvate mutase family protein n=1 Tax=Sphingoaurantiacus capsulatus TaxID=1771310 RepID=A0ABV7X6M6_9SPHN